MMALGGILPELLWCLLATLGFGVLFQLRGRDLLWAGFCGVVAWGGWLAGILHSPWLANFIAAVCLTLASEIIARLRGTLAVAYLVPGLIPLVPGAQIYGAMEAAVARNLDAALDQAFATGVIATALVVGILAVSVLVRVASWMIRPAAPAEKGR